MSSPSHRARGFSIIELMVSLTIGLIVLAGLVSVLMANRQAFTIQQGSSFNQENLRFASSRLAWSIRMADFWGGIKPASITTTTNLTGIGSSGNCTAAWIVSVGDGLQNGVRGYDGASTFPITDCVDTANYVKGSDVIVLRYADTHGYDPLKASGPVFTSTDTNVVPNQTSIFLLSAVAQQGTLFRGSETVPSNPLGSTAGRYVYPFQFEMYYLRPCSDPGADKVCGTTDDGDAASRSPTLMRMRLDTSGALVSEAVVDGVEQMQFEYASPAVGSNPASPFQAASAANFATVTQVRVSLVMRSTARDTAVPHAVDYTAAGSTVSGHCQYKISATGEVTKAGSGNKCALMDTASFGTLPHQFVRLLSSQVIVVRNRVRG